MTHGIVQAVGKGAPNDKGDTGVVQDLLNCWMANDPQFKAACEGKTLIVDRDCGPLTVAAITAFQSIVMRWRPDSCDGRIDPHGKTWIKLNGNVANAHAIPFLPVTREIAGLAGASVGFQSFAFDPFGGNQSFAPPAGHGASAGKMAAKAGKQTNKTADDPVAFKQRDYATTNLGKGTKTISQWGCTLCSLTMAATAIGSRTKHWPAGLQPADLTPIKANEILKKGGAFQTGSSAMAVAAGARALGMKAVEYGHGNTALPTPDDGYAQIIGHLYGGGLVAVWVDYKDKKYTTDYKKALGDHWLLLTSVTGDSIKALDPARKAKSITFGSCPPDGRTRTHNDEKAVLFGTSGDAAQLNYAVTRYILLSRKPAKEL
ncbi:hypothetical protein V8J85_01110 [Yoonia sp. 2307UL14-13]